MIKKIYFNDNLEDAIESIDRIIEDLESARDEANYFFDLDEVRDNIDLTIYNLEKKKEELEPLYRKQQEEEAEEIESEYRRSVWCE